MSTPIRTNFLIALLGVAWLLAPATAQTIKVTPQTLTDWAVTGADLNAMTQASQLALPAGAKLARIFPTGDIGINMTTQPVFAGKPSECPIIQLGSTAVVFVRSGNTGTLQLLVDTQQPLVLPYTFILDENGRAADPVQLAFVLSGNMVGVSAQDQTVTYPVTTAADAPVEVAVTAGSANELPISDFEVVCVLPNPGHIFAVNWVTLFG